MARLTLSFLGTFQVTLEQQPITRFRSSNNQGLLVYLALNGETAVPRESLATLFWPEETGKNGRNNLRQALYQLRTLLGDTRNGAQPFLTITRQTVQFNQGSSFTIDVGQFLAAIEARDLETAVPHYHGELLPGFTCDSLQFEAWLRQERESLHHLALEVMFELAQDHLRDGRYDKAQAAARRQLSLEPWREPAFRQLMQVYALSGDRANALAQYDLCRQQIWAELAVEPDPETVALYEAIQAGRYGPVVSTEALRPPVRVRHNLPADATPFVGRELELFQISKMLVQEKQRLVTLVGPGGMGKTRLALAAGAELLEQFQDGVYFVDLTPLTRPEEIILSIAAALKYQAPDSDEDIQPQLLASLSRQRLLLILDNFEHLLTAASLLNDILKACPQVSLLATSRQRLNLASESRYELGGLDYPDSLLPDGALVYTAVQLFVDSGRRVQPDFELINENVAEVIRICQMVQGMPLGLLLAAAWLELLSPAEIAAEIEESLEFLTADLADLPPRQRSMQAVFERSWQMMTPAEQEVMVRLSVFRGSFTRDAAEQVAGANLRLLLSLVNKSLLHRQAKSGRFTMQELLRQFAAQQGRDEAAAEQVSRDHCRYFAQMIAREVWRAVSYHPMHFPQQFAADRDNIRRAWSFAVAHGLAWELSNMVKGMVAFSFAQGIPPVAIPDQAIESLRSHGVSETEHEMLSLRLNAFGYRMGQEDQTVLRPQFMQFVAVIEKYGDPELRFWTYERIASLTLDFDDIAEAYELFEKAQQAALESRDELLIKTGYVIKFGVLSYLEKLDDTDEVELQALLAYFEPDFPNSYAVYTILGALSAYYLQIEAYDQAIFYGSRIRNLAKDWRDLLWITMSNDQLADIYLHMKRIDQAGSQHLDSLEWHLAIGQNWQILGHLWGKCVYTFPLFTGLEIVVPILSMIHHHPDATPFHKQKAAEDSLRFEPEMGSEAYAAAWERGKGLDLDTAVAQVRAILESAGDNP